MENKLRECAEGYQDSPGRVRMNRIMKKHLNDYYNLRCGTNKFSVDEIISSFKQDLLFWKNKGALTYIRTEQMIEAECADLVFNLTHPTKKSRWQHIDLKHFACQWDRKKQRMPIGGKLC